MRHDDRPSSSPGCVGIHLTRVLDCGDARASSSSPGAGAHESRVLDPPPVLTSSHPPDTILQTPSRHPPDSIGVAHGQDDESVNAQENDEEFVTPLQKRENSVMSGVSSMRSQGSAGWESDGDTLLSRWGRTRSQDSAGFDSEGERSETRHAPTQRREESSTSQGLQGGDDESELCSPIASSRVGRGQEVYARHVDAQGIGEECFSECVNDDVASQMHTERAESVMDFGEGDKTNRSERRLAWE